MFDKTFIMKENDQFAKALNATRFKNDVNIATKILLLQI